MLRILLVLVCVGCLVLAFRLLETRSIFFPIKQLAALPTELGLKFEEIFFNTIDGKKLHGWFIPGEPNRDTILFCHGNAGNISHRIEKLVFFHEMGFNVFIFDYRGYGKSNGTPSEKGLYQDALAAYDTLTSKGIPPERIIGYGESIGGAVIIDLAAKYPMKAVILENTFTSVSDMVKIHYPFIPSQLVSIRFDSKRKIASITIPKLIIQSENDKIVPPRLAVSLFEAAAQPKDFLEIRGDHNSGFFESKDLIEPKIREFLGQPTKS